MTTNDQTNGNARPSASLPWPEAYAALLPAIRKRWQVVGEIYLIRSLSGLSGAFVFAADVTCRDFTGQAILKLDKASNPLWRELNEAERHQRAFEMAPAFAQRHLPKIVHTLEQDGQIAILSTIAGRALEYATPWVDCRYERQLDVVRKLSVGLLEDWNKDYRLADGMHTPDQLLRAWLDYRLDPEKGRIHGFLEQGCGFDAQTPSFIFEGLWYPNPLAFACNGVPPAHDLRLRGLTGQIHGDLHGINVLVPSRGSDATPYYLIDLALYADQQFLFYDHAYFELSYLLRSRDGAGPAAWIGILQNLHQDPDGPAQGAAQSDDLGLIQLVQAWRHEVDDWVTRHEENRQSFAENQFTLARVAAGLNFVNKPLSDDQRLMALLYGAFALKRFLEFNNLDWPKHGPALEVSGQTADLVTDKVASHLPPAPAPRVPTADPPAPALAPLSRPNRRLWLGAALALLLALGLGLWVWAPWSRPATSPSDSQIGLSLPAKPSIVVLPFESQTPGNDSEMLASGLTAAITAGLAQQPELFVTTRSAADLYAGKSKDPHEVSNALKVRYVLKGSLQKYDNRVRILAELIDADSGQEAWAEHYDRVADDILLVQDEIALRVLVSLQVQLTEGYQAAIRGASTNNVEAYLLFTRAQKAYRTFTGQAMDQVQRLVDEILLLDPEFRQAKVLKAWSHIIEGRLGHSESVEASLQTAAALLREAAEIDGQMAKAEHAEILIADAIIAQSRGDYDLALEIGRQAAKLGPNNADLLAAYGQILLYARDYGRSAAFLKRAMRLSPTFASWYPLYLSRAYAFMGDSDRAVDWAKQGVARGESDLMRALNLANLVFAYQEAGRPAEANAAAREVMELAPSFTLESYRLTQPYLYEEDWQRYADALRAAGIP